MSAYKTQYKDSSDNNGETNLFNQRPDNAY